MNELGKCTECGKEMRWTENDIESYLFCSECNLYIRPDGLDEVAQSVLEALPEDKRLWFVRRLHPEKIFVIEVNSYEDIPESGFYFSSTVETADEEILDDSWVFGKAIRGYYKRYPDANPKKAYLIKTPPVWRYFFPREGEVA